MIIKINKNRYRHKAMLMRMLIDDTEVDFLLFYSIIIDVLL